MKKKFLAVLLAGAMVLGVTACGSSKDGHLLKKKKGDCPSPKVFERYE